LNPLASPGKVLAYALGFLNLLLLFLGVGLLILAEIRFEFQINFAQFLLVFLLIFVFRSFLGFALIPVIFLILSILVEPLVTLFRLVVEIFYLPK
jgi:hypothetical protein